MLIRFYKADGETPYNDGRTKMTGGTQEDPVLEWVEEPLVVMCPGRKVGDVFNLRTNDGWSNPRFVVFEDGKAKQIFSKNYIM